MAHRKSRSKRRTTNRAHRRTKARKPLAEELAAIARSMGMSLLTIMPVSRFKSLYDRMASSLGVQRKDSSSPPTKLRFLPSQSLQAFRNRFKRHIELVDIPRTGPLTQLPVELQLEILFNLDYWELKNLNASCRYYRHFISKTMLDDARERTIVRFKEIERQGRLTKNQKPCYTCLRMMHYTKFHDPNAPKATVGGTPAAAKPTTPLPVGSRYCISCGLKGDKFKPGQGIVSASQTAAICKHCKRFQKKPIESYTLRPGYACKSCDREVVYLQESGPIIRSIQTIIAVIIFALACSGRAVPRSSRITHGTWRWIYTIALDLSTLGACGISWAFRNTRQASGHTFRDDDHTFSLPIELLGALGWLGVVISLVWEGTHPLYKGEFDRIAVALAVVSSFEFLFFVVSLAMCSSRCVRHFVVNTKDDYS